MKLTAKQQRFVEEYLLDLNATAAAERAGYRQPNKQGPRLLVNVGIAAAIAEAQAERAERVELTQDYVVESLLEVVERTMQRAPVMVRRGKEMVQVVDDEGRHVWQFNGKVAVAALGLLGKHLGMFVERAEISGVDGGPLRVTVTRRIVHPDGDR